MELAPDTRTTWRIGDGTAAFYNYIYYTVTSQSMIPFVVTKFGKGTLAVMKLCGWLQMKIARVILILNGI